MREPEELATAPDYRWRRWWNQFWIHSCVVVWILVAVVSRDAVFIPAIATGAFYWFVSRTVKQLDANARGFDSPDLGSIMKTALERKRLDAQDEETLAASGLPITAHKDEGRDVPDSPPIPMRTASRPTFGRSKVPPKKPVDLPRRRP